jgi:23S rRNA pseudouridine2605 synthase
MLSVWLSGDDMRLNRYISASGAASRRKGEDIIRSGRIKVNGEIVTDPARNVEPGRDTVLMDGKPLVINPEKRYYILNKPEGVIVSRGDTHGRTTVMDLMGAETKGVVPVGRLDYDTLGVLLLTDDGDLTHRLIHPSFGVDKVYRAVVEGSVGGDSIRRIRDGLTLEDGPTAPAVLTIIESGAEQSIVELTIHQGRNRQVRRMLDHLGHPVIMLERMSFGGITAGKMKPGDYRELTSNEVKMLKKMINYK